MSSAAARNWADDGSESEGEDLVPQKKAPEPAKPASAPAPAPAPAQERREHHPREGGGRGGDRERGGERFNRRERERSPPRPPAEINPNGPFIVYISNLPHDTTESELRAYFHHAGCDCHSISVPTDKVTGRGRGFAHIEFKDKATMIRALTANGKLIKGRTVTVEVGRSQGNRGDRDRDRRGDGKLGDRRDRKPESAAPAEGATASGAAPVIRKKLELAPRTKPVEAVGAAVGTPSSYSSIFGGGKPREEAVAAAAAAPPALPTPSIAEPAVAAVTEKIGDLAVEAPAAPPAEKAPAERPSDRRDRVKRSEGTPRDGTTRPKNNKPSEKDGKRSTGARTGGRAGSAPATGAAVTKKSTPRTTTSEEGWTSTVTSSAPAKEQQAVVAAPAEKKAVKNSNVFALLNDESEDEN